MTYEQQKELNDMLTELTGVKHYPTVEEMLCAKFEELGETDDNGGKIVRYKNDR